MAPHCSCAAIFHAYLGEGAKPGFSAQEIIRLGGSVLLEYRSEKRDRSMSGPSLRQSSVHRYCRIPRYSARKEFIAERMIGCSAPIPCPLQTTPHVLGVLWWERLRRLWRRPSLRLLSQYRKSPFTRRRQMRKIYTQCEHILSSQALNKKVRNSLLAALAFTVLLMKKAA
jgi:hypothetical protein